MALPNEKIEEYVNECFEVWESFLYFLESYCWIEDKQSGEAILFKLWPGQKRILSSLTDQNLLIILKARQLGLTWLAAAYCLWHCITQRMQLIIVISAKEDWAIEFLDRVRFIRNRLPDWIFPPVGKDGAQHMTFVHEYGKDGKPLVFSEIKSLATTLEGAQSKTPNILIMDETARNRYAKQIYAASKPGIDKAGGRIIVISNSHKDGVGWGWTRSLYSNSMKAKNAFARIFMPWWDCPERITDIEAGSLEKHPSGFDGTGKVICVDFKRKQIEAGYDEDDFSQNYPETEGEAVSAVAGSFFGKTLARHDAFIQAHDTTGIKGFLRQDPKTKDIEFIEDPKGTLEIWRWPYYLVEDWDGIYWTNMYAVGSDVSEGLGRSYSVGYVLDRKLDELVARLRGNRIDAHQWGSELDLLAKWYSSAHDHTGKQDSGLICAERTGAGITTVKRLETLESNQYVREIPGKMGMSMTREFGWSETEAAKWDLCGDLKTWFKTTKGGLYCPLLIDEASTTIRHENGRIGPEDDTKLWDCVVAAGCTIQASHFMGEGPKKIIPPVTGWRAREKERGKSNWAT